MHHPLSFTVRQINAYTEREILNHRILRHPHVVTFREVGILFGPSTFHTGAHKQRHAFGSSRQHHRHPARSPARPCIGAARVSRLFPPKSNAPRQPPT